MTGIVIGKFYPPHLGHKHLIDTPRARVNRLIVILCVHPSQTIPGSLRLSWLKQIHPDCEIVAVADTLPEDPKLWADFTVEFLGFVPELVFTSESYGDEYAKFMGSTHLCVDLERRRVPISGTAIRNDPLSNLEYLEPVVREYFETVANLK